MADADLAVLGSDTSPDHDRVAGAINAGTAVAFGRGAAQRKLLATLQNVPPAHVSPTDDRSPILSEEIDYTFGYELPSQPLRGVAMAYPASDGVLELHTRNYRHPSDQRALNSVVEEYRGTSSEGDQVSTTSTGYDDEWERNGYSSWSTENCGGGTVKHVITCYTLPDDDGIVSWQYSDRMTAGASDEACADYGTLGLNRKAYRRMTYGDGYGGDILSYDPTTTTGTTTASVSISTDGFGATWTYEIPDVEVHATENHTENAIRWRHDVQEGSEVEDETFTSEPGVIVGYPSGTDVAEYYTETEFVFKSTWNNTWKITDSSEGGWMI